MIRLARTCADTCLLRAAKASRPRSLAMTLAAVLAIALVGGCRSVPNVRRDTSGTSRETASGGSFSGTKPAAPVIPPPPMLDDPESAVYSYLLWISYAYRVSDSEVATRAFDEYEGVRIDSYVELNRQKGRAIDQRLTGFQPGRVTTTGVTATVSARETWAYRYIRMSDATYDGPTHAAQYDTTYTVVNLPARGWLVHRVSATPIGPAPK